jgi:hypothetical protein
LSFQEDFMKKTILHILLFLGCYVSAQAQSDPFQIFMEPLTIPDLGGIQSYAVGQHDGRWLIIGGRLDGLHRRQPFASFDVAGNNNRLIVVDPSTRQTWSAPLSSLSAALQEQLSATNIQYFQEGDYLYLVGGYGYSATIGARKTFDNLTAVQVPSLINAVISGSPFTSFFRQISDPRFAVTGGHLDRINNTYYLVCGNKFDGNYNPGGGPSYTQVYTEAIRRFQLSDDGTTINITHLPEWKDATNLHRRDLNVVPQILPDGREGITAFSGVFQVGADLPFLNCVQIDSSGFAVKDTFLQYYNHYHCPVLPMFDAVSREMHTVFFGGIAQFYDSLGILVKDDNVPFVATIARVTRNAGGTMSEHKLPLDMPALLGASANFIPIKTVPHYRNDVIQLDALSTDTTLTGYLYGGIHSNAPNIFFTNTGSESVASNTLFKVYVVKAKGTKVHELNAQSTGGLRLQVYPNPARSELEVEFILSRPGAARIKIVDPLGKVLKQTGIDNTRQGINHYKARISDRGAEYYLLYLETSEGTAVQKIIVD